MLMKFLLYGVALCVLLLVIGSFFADDSTERISLRIECSSPYHAYVEWTENGVSYSDEFTKDGKYFLPLEGKNLSVYATAWKVDPSNIDDKLSMTVTGKGDYYKNVETYYPQWDLEIDGSGAENRALQEGDDK